MARQIATIQSKTTNPARMSFAAYSDAAKVVALRPSPRRLSQALDVALDYQAIGYKILGTRDLHRSHTPS